MIERVRSSAMLPFGLAVIVEKTAQMSGLVSNFE
jgi:hypothetical protein